MPVFEYKALTAAGKAVQGLREAESPKALRGALRERRGDADGAAASYGKAAREAGEEVPIFAASAHARLGWQRSARGSCADRFTGLDASL